MTWIDVLKEIGPLAGLLTGILAFVGFLARKWYKALKKATDARIEAESKRMQAEMKGQEAGFQQRVAQMEAEFARETLSHREALLAAQEVHRELKEERDRLSAELDQLQKRLLDIDTFDGRLWEREIRTTPPAFMPTVRRTARFIAVMNLKGGVGKTTLTANVGAVLAKRGHKVLIVDLDFQGTLTRLCINSDELKESIRRGRTTSQLFESGASLTAIAQRVRSVMLENATFDCVAASEELADAELRAQAKWLVTGTPDARFLFRPVFHDPATVEQYRFILFDCPPRLTTASVNALSCSDSLLVPVVLEQGSVEALPRTLNWLRKLQHVTHARLLGIVANRAEHYRSELISAQQTVYKFLPETVKRGGYDDPTLFRAIVKNSRNKIEDAANHGRIAAAEEEGYALFASVADEIEEGVR